MDTQNGLLTSGDVAAIFRVTKTTVKRWAEEGKLPGFRTLGGHYRFRSEDVEALRAETETEAPGSVSA